MSRAPYHAPLPCQVLITERWTTAQNKSGGHLPRMARRSLGHQCLGGQINRYAEREACGAGGEQEFMKTL
ncbi:hypothetical protein CEXT_172201 [Caerostris extrusa]|uniref:Uncharacterized protein n=1 Tax=Caerostris extrusa TaxID=172846 RepID=A0AAV4XA64_CAEEX|nr:hypothetical protein CEXT_172201 [Caerostris extrusa]